MNKKIVIITISLAAVIAAFTGVYAYQKHLSSFSGSNVSKSTLGQVDTTSDTYKQYAKLKGDAYDRAFLAITRVLSIWQSRLKKVLCTRK
jgi:hypothetical protein